MKKIPLLVILGPTATGKSDLAVKLAKMIARQHNGGFKGAEIVSADSRQVYRGMDIGTGKITRKEMCGVVHHLLDAANPRKQFTVFDFKMLAEQAIRDIYARGNLPIICGGTGFYIDTLVNNEKLPPVAADLKLRSKLESKSAKQLFNMLEKLDPDRAHNMNDSDNKNLRRLVRAIEVAAANNSALEKMGGQRNTRIVSEKYAPIFIGLNASKEILGKRIYDRLLKRIHAGMLDEAIKLHTPIKDGGGGLSWKRMEDLGLEYRYMARHLQGQMTLQEMIEKLEIEIRQYAKRQMTWFKRNKRIKWFESSQDTTTIEHVAHYITKIAT